MDTRAALPARRNGGARGEPDEGNPLPDLIDPITLEPVVTPGHLALRPRHGPGHLEGMWQTLNRSL